MINSIKNFSFSCLTCLVPILSILLLELIVYIPHKNEFWNFMRAAPLYAGIYFWSITRSDIFNFVTVFFLGILADVIGSTPLGVSIITILTMHILSIKLSDYFNINKFLYSWILFLCILLITLLFKAILISTFYRTIIPLQILFLELLINFTLYPLLTRIYSKIERRFIHLEDSYEKI